ncbi:MAG: hypothetical protein Q9212_004595 [Teloschistes hypoglaucus]
MSSTNAALDEYLERGRAVLGDLGQQKDILKGTQRRLYNVANTLGVSGETIRMVERRAKQDRDLQQWDAFTTVCEPPRPAAWPYRQHVSDVSWHLYGRGKGIDMRPVTERQL